MIEFENVSFSYEGQEHDSLHGISLKIADGECVLFCGRSGCGKTTVTRLVNGLIPQFYQGELQGRVLVDGQEISDLPMYQIAAKVGSVFQNPRTQFFNVDTDSEIAFGIENEARPVKELEERVEQTTKDLHIEKLRGKTENRVCVGLCHEPGNLSAGRTILKSGHGFHPGIERTSAADKEPGQNHFDCGTQALLSDGAGRPHCLSGRWGNSKDFYARGISPFDGKRTGTHGAAGS